MRAEAKSRLLPFQKFVVGVIEEKFGELAQNCKHRFPDSEGFPNCSYHSSAIGYCKPELCPRLRSKQSERDGTRKVIKCKEGKLIEGIKEWR